MSTILAHYLPNSFQGLHRRWSLITKSFVIWLGAGHFTKLLPEYTLGSLTAPVFWVTAHISQAQFNQFFGQVCCLLVSLKPHRTSKLRTQVFGICERIPPHTQLPFPVDVSFLTLNGAIVTNNNLFVKLWVKQNFVLRCLFLLWKQILLTQTESLRW